MHFAPRSKKLTQEMSLVNYELCGGSHAADMFEILAHEYFPGSNNSEESDNIV